MIRILPEAEAEAADAVQWYGLQRTGLGRAFKVQFRRALETVAHNPSVFPRDPAYIGSEVIRRCQFRRFSYHIVFSAMDDEILVIAVSHDRRKPAYWTDRLQ